MAIRNISLMGKNPDQPFDIQTEQARLAQMQEIAKTLLAQGMLQNEPFSFHTSPGNPFARDVPNIAGPIRKAMDRTQAEKDLADISDKQGFLAQLVNARNAEDMQRYHALRFGGEIPSPTEGSPAADAQPGQRVAGNLAKALLFAETSQNPALKEIAKEERKGLVTPRDLIANADKFDSANSDILTNPNARVEPPPKVTVERDVATTTKGGKVIGTQPVQTYTTGVFEGVPGVRSNITGNVTGLGGGNMTPDKNFEKNYGETVLALVKEGAKIYAEDVGTLADISQLREDIRNVSPDKFGAIAKARNWLNKAAEIIDPSKKLPDTANLETVMQGTGQFVLQYARKLAPVTKNDVDLLETILGGPSITKDALIRAMDVLEAATTRRMTEHQARVDALPLPPGVTKEQNRAYFAPSFSFTPKPPARTGGGTNAIRQEYGLPPVKE